MNTRPGLEHLQLPPRGPPHANYEEPPKSEPNPLVYSKSESKLSTKGHHKSRNRTKILEHDTFNSCARWISRAAQILDMCLRRPSRLLYQGAPKGSPHQKPHQSSALLVLPMLNCNSHRYRASSWLCSSERTEIPSSSPFHS